MLLPRDSNSNNSSDSQSRRDDGNNGSQSAILAIVTIVIIISALIIAYVLLKHFRKLYSNPKYIPTKYLKRKWEAWTPMGFMPKGSYSSQLQENSSVPTLHARSARGSTYMPDDPERPQASEASRSAADTAVDRHTSVRSVMTLPAYSTSAGEHEQVLGREGERDGIDVVLEQPETAEEEEDRREEEMQSLYAIRVQRRQEIAQREARRQERRAAQARGDRETLNRLRQESAQRAQERDLTGAAAMIAEHQSRSKERRVSSVNYADLGVARHDGTRLRANSSESERPLLDSAASIAGSSMHPVSTRTRGRSASSVLSVSDADSDSGHPPFGRSGSDFEIVNMNQVHSSHNVSNINTPASNRSRASTNTGPTPPAIDTSVDISDAQFPSSEPPSYDGDGFEEAPPYSSPVQERAPRPLSDVQEVPSPQTSERPRLLTQDRAPTLPELNRLPSIRMTEPTPISPNANAEWPSPGRSSSRR